MTAKVKQTKLGFKLRQAADAAEKTAKPDDLNRANRIACARQWANHLDRACFALAVRGPAVKNLGSYIEAKRQYKLLTGEDYAD